MSEKKVYEFEGLTFEFTPNGNPFTGLLRAEGAEAVFMAEVNLTKLRSRKNYAEEAKAHGLDAALLHRALNELCAWRADEAEAAAESQVGEEEAKGEEEPDLAAAAEELLSPGVLQRFSEDAATVYGVTGDRQMLKLQSLVAAGAQLQPLPSSRPVGANNILTGESGRGKNHICNAVASLLPEEFYVKFESASAKSFYYEAEGDPQAIKHRWLYPDEAEATDYLVELLRPLLSGGRAEHRTVNKDAAGRNVHQHFHLEGPVSITIPTVRNKLDSQLQTRNLVADLGDYEGRIASHTRAYSRQLLSRRAGEDHSGKVRAWQAALRSLTTVRTVVFDLDHEQFCFDSDEVSHGARLWANLLGLMLAHAWLEQRNREVIELADGQKAIGATPEDYRAAYEVFKATCERSVVNLSDTHRRILTAVHALKTESGFTGGFGHRKIAEKAGISTSTVSEHRTFLIKSAKLLVEDEGGGLNLVSGADPSWWTKGDLLAGFPRPEQVARWFEQRHSPEGEKSADQGDHPSKEGHDPHDYGENPDRGSSDHPTIGADHPAEGEEGGLSGDRRPYGGDRHAPDQSAPDHGGEYEEDEGGDRGDRQFSGGRENKSSGTPLSFDVAPGESAQLSDLKTRRREGREAETTGPYANARRLTEEENEAVANLIDQGFSATAARAEVLGEPLQEGQREE